MIIFSWAIVVLWVVFIAYWFISALGAKKTLRTPFWWQGVWFRAAFIILFLVVSHIPAVDEIAHSYYAGNIPTSFWFGVMGVIICAAGIAFAIWARIYLGRNWGMPMTLQEGHELVTSGPYKFVRHPIYTGFLLAMIGSVLAEGIVWILALVVFIIYFIFSAKKEEKIMIEQFPNEYPDYMKRTKMLIPFIW